jgi:hypothetical protein
MILVACVVNSEIPSKHLLLFERFLANSFTRQREGDPRLKLATSTKLVLLLFWQSKDSKFESHCLRYIILSGHLCV